MLSTKERETLREEGTIEGGTHGPDTCEDTRAENPPAITIIPEEDPDVNYYPSREVLGQPTIVKMEPNTFYHFKDEESEFNSAMVTAFQQGLDPLVEDGDLVITTWDEGRVWEKDLVVALINESILSLGYVYFKNDKGEFLGCFDDSDTSIGISKQRSLNGEGITFYPTRHTFLIGKVTHIIKQPQKEG